MSRAPIPAVTAARSKSTSAFADEARRATAATAGVANKWSAVADDAHRFGSDEVDPSGVLVDNLIATDAGTGGLPFLQAGIREDTSITAPNVSAGECCDGRSDPVVRRLSLQDEIADVPSHSAEALPFGDGALFRCAVCGNLVYESQLDYHITVCPDPAGAEEHRSDDTKSGKDQPNIGQITRSQSVDRVFDGHHEAHLSTSLEPSCVGGGLRHLYSSEGGVKDGVHLNEAGQDVFQDGRDAAPMPRRVWRQWEDSELELHHAQARRRISRKQELLKEELDRREHEQCTFTPRLTCSRRSSSVSATPRSSRSIYIDKQQRLDRIRDEMYAEVTGRPEISRYAREWAKMERECWESAASREGKRAPDVWERLYKVASRHCAVREQHRFQQQPSEQGAQQVRSGNTPRSPRCHADCGGNNHKKPAVSRTSPPGELLYQDALERRQRQQSLEAHVCEFEDAERRVAVQMQGRSRRYYWQMLERQIKEAFDTAAGGKDTLSFHELEDFLKNFGVLRSPKTTDTVLIDRFCEDTQKLCVALWRHLDPEKTGSTRFLTLTVFFHVLMGAVDEEAQCLHNLSSAKQHEEVDAIQAAEQEQQKIGDFTEESSANEAAAAAAAAAAEAADPEGRDICALLMRFDPRQLRQEFHSLYVQRMHHNVNYPAPAPRASPSLELCTNSRILADRVVRRQRDSAGAEGQPLGGSHVDLLHWRHMQAEQRKEELRDHLDARETQDCTFHPSLPSSSRRSRSADSSRLGTSYNRLYAMSCAQQKEREAKTLAAQQARFTKELSMCTFTPDIKRRRAHSQQSTSVMMPRGYTDCTQRLRRAFVAQATKRRLLEDRFQAASPSALAAFAAVSPVAARSSADESCRFGGAKGNHPSEQASELSSDIPSMHFVRDVGCAESQRHSQPTSATFAIGVDMPRQSLDDNTLGVMRGVSTQMSSQGTAPRIPHSCVASPSPSKNDFRATHGSMTALGSGSPQKSAHDPPSGTCMQQGVRQGAGRAGRNLSAARTRAASTERSVAARSSESRPIRRSHAGITSASPACADEMVQQQQQQLQQQQQQQQQQQRQQQQRHAVQRPV